MHGENNVDRSICGFKRKRDEVADIPRELSEPEGGWVCDAGRPHATRIGMHKAPVRRYTWIRGIMDALTSGSINGVLESTHALYESAA